MIGMGVGVVVRAGHRTIFRKISWLRTVQKMVTASQIAEGTFHHFGNYFYEA
jgi:hypothetical protein